MSKTKPKCPHCDSTQVVLQEQGENHSLVLQGQCLKCGKAWTEKVKPAKKPIAPTAPTEE